MRIDYKVYEGLGALRRIAALSVGLFVISFLSSCVSQVASNQPLQLVSGSAPV